VKEQVSTANMYRHNQIMMFSMSLVTCSLVLLLGILQTSAGANTGVAMIVVSIILCFVVIGVNFLEEIHEFLIRSKYL
jgi:hypothetical protein